MGPNEPNPVQLGGYGQGPVSAQCPKPRKTSSARKSAGYAMRPPEIKVEPSSEEWSAFVERMRAEQE